VRLASIIDQASAAVASGSRDATGFAQGRTRIAAVRRGDRPELSGCGVAEQMLVELQGLLVERDKDDSLDGCIQFPQRAYGYLGR
jgi:hypothetical protein